MSYQVLARKWRPKTFQEMAGQAHVLRALENAMSQGRLHHAYLFTGTRGVGKTTVARILAKCLNCEVGISSLPCGTCSTCLEIDQGRSVDLIEVDAASRTRVEDTRELLDNVQYAPTRSRFKIYLIDEVHMLSMHSFNALLKTLEEPPEHVKFLLATTDPQKLPVTVLSRCLQFSLKNMTPQKIVAHLQTILPQEQIEFEEAGLWEIARAADGSMRDALSLTDQAIAFGNGRLAAADVQAMLGTVDQQRILRLIDQIAQQNLAEALAEVTQLAGQGSDLKQVLADIILIFHRIALAQLMPDAIDNALGDREFIHELANKTTPQSIQLLYQTALMGSKDLQLVPDLKAGLEMIVIRMMLFVPYDHIDETAQKKSAHNSSVEAAKQAPISVSQQELKQEEQAPSDKVLGSIQASSLDKPIQYRDSLDGGTKKEALPEAVGSQITAERSSVNPRETAAAPEVDRVDGMISHLLKADVSSSVHTNSLDEEADDKLKKWMKIIQNLGAEGIAQHLALNSCLMHLDDDKITIQLAPASEPMRTASAEARLEKLLQKTLKIPIKLQVEIGELAEETPHQHMQRLKRIQLDLAEEALLQEPVIKGLEQKFGAQLKRETIALIEA